MAVSLKEKLNHIRLQERSQGNYFVLRRSLVQSGCMSQTLALFYSDLCNLACMASDKWTKEIDGKLFFLCTVAYLEETGLCWDKRTQHRMLRLLQKKKHVEVVLKGSPPMRYVWINTETAENAVNEWRAKSPTKRQIQRGQFVPFEGDNLSPNQVTTPNGVVTEQQKKPPGLAAPTRVGDCDGLGLDQPPKSEYHALAMTLHNTMSRLGVLQRKDKDLTVHRLGAWASELQSMCRDRSVSASEVEKTIQWWEQHHNDPYMAQPESVRTFCDRYHKIVKAMKTSSNGHAQKYIELSADEQAVVKELSKLPWPGDSISRLPQTVHESFKGHRHLVDALKNVQDNSDDIWLRRLAKRLLEDYGKRTRDFVESWVRAVHDKHHTWDDWSGTVKPFGINNDRVVGQCRSTAGKFSIDHSLWDRLFNILRT